MKSQQKRVIIIGATALISLGILTWYLIQRKKEEDSSGGQEGDTPTKKPRSAPDSGTVGTVASTTDEKGIHSEIEELDKKGKEFFKQKEVRWIDSLKPVLR